MHKSLLQIGLQLFNRQWQSSPVVHQPWTIQVREKGGFNALRLADARVRQKRMQWFKKLPYLATSRLVEKEDAASDERVSLSKDGRVIVCWHPETPFPYEMTRPIPLDVTPTDSNLKLQALVPVREIFRKKHKDMVVRELMQLTFTSKHRWYCPPKRIARLKKLDVKGFNPVRDREYL